MTKFAQSRGEWPGSRRTFLDERFDDGRVDAVGAREADDPRERLGGPRRVEAADGGGRRDDARVGGTRRALPLE